MDLIFANSDLVDIGVLHRYEMDLAYGTDENDFEVNVPLSDYNPDVAYLYIEGTEYGGVVDGIRIDNESGTLTYFGRSWHGILESKYIYPDSGSDYYNYNGKLKDVITEIISRIDIVNMFRVAEDMPDVNVPLMQGRYINSYKAINLVMYAVGMKLKLYHDGNTIVINAEPIVNYSAYEEWDSDKMYFRIVKANNFTNHLICLGKGELRNRTVVHLYMDADGNVSTTKTFSGDDEIVDVYDYPNAESSTELIDGGTKKLQEIYSKVNSVEADLSGMVIYDVGDIVSAYDNVTKTYIEREVTKKIIKAKNGKVEITCQIGDSYEY